VPGPLLHHDWPDALLVLRTARPGGDRDEFVPHLDLHLGVRHQVLVPAGMVWCTAFRCDQHVVVAVAPIDERELPRLAGLAARSVQHEAARTVPIMTDFAAGRFILAYVLVAEKTVVRHAA